MPAPTPPEGAQGGTDPGLLPRTADRPLAPCDAGRAQVAPALAQGARRSHALLKGAAAAQGGRGDALSPRCEGHPEGGAQHAFLNRKFGGAAIIVQSAARGMAERFQFRAAKSSATTLQAAMRRLLATPLERSAAACRIARDGRQHDSRDSKFAWRANAQNEWAAFRPSPPPTASPAKRRRPAAAARRGGAQVGLVRRVVLATSLAASIRMQAACRTLKAVRLAGVLREEKRKLAASIHMQSACRRLKAVRLAAELREEKRLIEEERRRIEEEKRLAALDLAMRLNAADLLQRRGKVLLARKALDGRCRLDGDCGRRAHACGKGPLPDGRPSDDSHPARRPPPPHAGAVPEDEVGRSDHRRRLAPACCNPPRRQAPLGAPHPVPRARRRLACPVRGHPPGGDDDCRRRARALACRGLFVVQRNAAIRVQSAARAKQCAAKHGMFVAAVEAVQAAARMLRAIRLRQKLSAARKIESAGRGMLSRRVLATARAAATTIAAAERCRKAKVVRLTAILQATLLQRAARGMVQRIHLKSAIAATIKLQAAARRLAAIHEAEHIRKVYAARRLAAELFAAKLLAADTIQRRGMVLIAKQNLATAKAATTTIAAALRRKSAMKRLATAKASTVIMQSAARRLLAVRLRHTTFTTYTQASTVVQSYWRGVTARIMLMAMADAASKIAATWHSFVLTRKLQGERRGAIGIQRSVRGLFARKQVATSFRACIRMQAAARGLAGRGVARKAKAEAATRRAAAITLQCWARKLAATQQANLLRAMAKLESIALLHRSARFVQDFTRMRQLKAKRQRAAGYIGGQGADDCRRVALCPHQDCRAEVPGSRPRSQGAREGVRARPSFARLPRVRRRRVRLLSPTRSSGCATASTPPSRPSSSRRIWARCCVPSPPSRCLL